MTIDTTRFATLDEAGQIRHLIGFSYHLTIVGRGSYRADDPITNLHGVNELQHQITQFALAIVEREGKAYPLETFAQIVLEMADSYEIGHEVRDAWRRATPRTRSSRR